MNVRCASLAGLVQVSMTGDDRQGVRPQGAKENLGVQMLRQAAEKTGDAVGGGTSTSTILAQTMFADGVRNVIAGASAIDLKARIGSRWKKPSAKAARVLA